MVVCVRVNNTFYSIICTFASILKLLDLFFPCFPSVTRRSDIDECSSGSHDCHQNATCVNTAGLYDCICRPGLTGNGRNCSGEAIIFFSFVKRQPGKSPLPHPTSFVLSRKLGDKNADLVTLRWEGRSSLFFGKSGGGANASSQDPRLHRSLG